MSLLSCKKFTQLSSLSMEKPLSPWQKFQHKFHFCLCFTCRKFERQVKTMEKLLRIAHDKEEATHFSCCEGLGDDAKERMKKCFHKD